MPYQIPVEKMSLTRLMKESSSYESPYSRIIRGDSIQTPLSQITQNAYSSVISGRCSPLAELTGAAYHNIFDSISPVYRLSRVLEEMKSRRTEECEQAFAMHKELNLGGINLASAALDLLRDNAPNEAENEQTEQMTEPFDGNNNNDQGTAL